MVYEDRYFFLGEFAPGPVLAKADASHSADHPLFYFPGNDLYSYPRRRYRPRKLSEDDDLLIVVGGKKRRSPDHSAPPSEEGLWLLSLDQGRKIGTGLVSLWETVTHTWSRIREPRRELAPERAPAEPTRLLTRISAWFNEPEVLFPAEQSTEEREPSPNPEVEEDNTAGDQKETKLSQEKTAEARRSVPLAAHGNGHLPPATTTAMPAFPTQAPRPPVRIVSTPPKFRIHKRADSLLSTSSGFSNFRGVLNWALILLAMASGRVALENIIKYGILVDPFSCLEVFLESPLEWPSTILTLSINVYIMTTYFIECKASKGSISDVWVVRLYVVLLSTLLGAPVIWIYKTEPFPVFAAFALIFNTSAFLKIISYAHVNYWCRLDGLRQEHPAEGDVKRRRRLKSVATVATFHQAEANGDIPNQHVRTVVQQAKVRYPDNLSIKDMYFFMLAPTLCYELQFPRSERVRKRFMLKRLLEMIILPGVIIGLVQQWIMPTIKNSMEPFRNMDLGMMLERLLKLSIPSHIIWLICFYWLFHAYFNVVAELIGFADRTFYSDWWNCKDVMDFWKTWNVPVHRWCTRHLYIPMRARGLTFLQASLVVFLVSAFFHEYLVSVPLRMFRLWAFFAMLGQDKDPMSFFAKSRGFFPGDMAPLSFPYPIDVPLVLLCKTLQLNEKNGNIVVWLSIIVGQPAAVLMYYHDYYVLNN